MSTIANTPRELLYKVFPDQYDKAYYNLCGCPTSITKEGAASFGHCEKHDKAYPLGQGISRKGYTCLARS